MAFPLVPQPKSYRAERKAKQRKEARVFDLTRAQVRALVMERAKGCCERCGRKVDFDVRKERLFIEQCVDDWHMDEDGDLWCPQCLEEARQNAERDSDSHERAGARARNNDFADTGGKDWT